MSARVPRPVGEGPATRGRPLVLGRGLLVRATWSRPVVVDMTGKPSRAFPAARPAPVAPAFPQPSTRPKCHLVLSFLRFDSTMWHFAREHYRLISASSPDRRNWKQD